MKTQRTKQELMEEVDSGSNSKHERALVETLIDIRDLLTQPQEKPYVGNYQPLTPEQTERAIKAGLMPQEKVEEEYLIREEETKNIKHHVLCGDTHPVGPSCPTYVTPPLDIPLGNSVTINEDTIYDEETGKFTPVTPLDIPALLDELRQIWIAFERHGSLSKEKSKRKEEIINALSNKH